MFPENLEARICLTHEENKIILVCPYLKCDKTRLICCYCLTEHNDHLETLFEYNKLNDIVREMQIDCDRLYQQCNNNMGEICALFNQLQKVIKKKYDVKFSHLNKLNHSEFNQQLYYICFFKEQLKNLQDQFRLSCVQFQKQLTLTLQSFNVENINQVIENDQNQQDITAFYEIGQQYFINQDYYNAIQIFDQILEINSTHVGSLQYKADSLLELESYKESMIWYDKILAIEPNNKQAMFGRGCSLKEQEQYLESIKWFDKALKVDSTFKEALSNKGHSLRLIGRDKESIEWQEKALLIDSDYPNALFGKGESLRMLKKYPEALDYLNRALIFDENNFEIFGSKGALLTEIGSYKEAEECLRKSLSLNPDYEWGMEQLGISITQQLERLQQLRGF